MNPRRSLGIAMALVAAVAIRAEGTAPQNQDPPGKRWRDGAVRYLLSREEYARYGRLETDGARGAFVERFWRRLDPDPTTPTNEFRERFEARIVEAERRFPEGNLAGWKSDRGQVLLLLGDPDHVRTEPGDPRSVTREVWTYSRPAGRGGAPLEIVFYRGMDGEYRLDPETSDPARSRQEPLARERERALLRIQLRQAIPGMTAAQLDHVIQTYFTPPANSPRREAAEVVAARIPAQLRPGPVPTEGEPSGGAIQEEAHFFEALDGSVLTILQLSFLPPAARGDAWDPDPSDPGFTAVAYVAEAPSGPDEIARAQNERIDLMPRDGPAGDPRLFFAGRAFLEPGVAYELRFAVGDHLQRTLSVRAARIDVPWMGAGRFSTSSVVAAESFGPLPSGKESLFAVGSEEVVPRPGGAFHRGEPLRLYLQVYGAAISAETTKSSVDVTFRFKRYQGHRWKAQAKPLSFRRAEGASLGLALPVGDWPEGDYRVEVELHDLVAGARTSVEGSFRITD